MVYVHSKAMIADDEVAVVGTANINQRSMDGGRDTELAIATFQPHFTSRVQGKLPRGEVAFFNSSILNKSNFFFGSTSLYS